MASMYPSLVKDYSSQDVFNANEIGLYFKALPEGMMVMDGDKSSRGKVQND